MHLRKILLVFGKNNCVFIEYATSIFVLQQEWTQVDFLMTDTVIESVINRPSQASID